jgi:hypothetical protein
MQDHKNKIGDQYQTKTCDWSTWRLISITTNQILKTGARSKWYKTENGNQSQISVSWSWVRYSRLEPGLQSSLKNETAVSRWWIVWADWILLTMEPRTHNYSLCKQIQYSLQALQVKVLKAVISFKTQVSTMHIEGLKTTKKSIKMT